MQNFNMRPFRSLSLRAGAFLLVCLLAGCSALRLGYANGDTFVYWWLNGYVDFSDAQKPWVKAHIDRLFDWHRSTQLKDYAQLLAHLQQRLQHGPATAADVRKDFSTVRARATLVLEKAAPELADLALSLQPEQIAHLEKKFADNTEKYRKEYLRGSVDDRQQHRFKKVMKQAEYWFGAFTDEQEAAIRKASDARPLDYEIWLAERKRRHQEMLAMLRKVQSEKPPRDVVVRMIRESIARGVRNFTYAEHKAFFDATDEGVAQMIATIVNVATPEQKAHAVKRLQKWISDCHALAGNA